MKEEKIKNDWLLVVFIVIGCWLMVFFAPLVIVEVLWIFEHIINLVYCFVTWQNHIADMSYYTQLRTFIMQYIGVWFRMSLLLGVYLYFLTKTNEN